MKIISFKICPFVQRVTALLEAKKIPYEIEFIDLNNKPAWFLELSPHGQVPVLVTDNGVALFESDAIVEYLEEALPPLEPNISLEQKAINRAWSTLASKNYLAQCGAQRSADESTLETRNEKLHQAFDKVEAQLGTSRYFGSENLGMVDITWLTLLHRAHLVEQHSGYDFIGDRPKLKRRQGELMKTGLAAKSVAPDFEDAFASFYLSDETYLGRGQNDCNAPRTGKSCC
ncbi:MAG: glutathione S-transferase family protein [Hyphomicrobiales bacterium]